MNISGLVGPESPKASVRSKIGGSTNFCPNMFDTYAVMAKITRSCKEREVVSN